MSAHRFASRLAGASYEARGERPEGAEPEQAGPAEQARPRAEPLALLDEVLANEAQLLADQRRRLLRKRPEVLGDRLFARTRAWSGHALLPSLDVLARLCPTGSSLKR